MPGIQSGMHISIGIRICIILIYGPNQLVSMKQLTDLPELDTIKKQLKRQKISQLALAKASGVPQSVISRISSGAIKDPSYSTLRKLLLAIDRPKNRSEDEELRTAEQLMSRKIVSVRPHNKLADAWEIMKARNFSQIPVFDDRDRAIGSISESFLAAYVTLEYGLDRRIDEVEVEDTFPMVGRNTAASTVADILKTKQAVLVVEKGRAIGIVTRHDVIEKR
jgi:predicted transcriptional regulator